MAESARPLAIGVSLKLYLDVAATAAWSTAVSAMVKRSPAMASGRVRLFVIPSLPAVPVTIDAFRGTGVDVGAQDLFWEERGAYTGGVSGDDLAAIGCRCVEIAHAERHRVFGEDEATAARKLAAAFRCGLEPILCVGEKEAGDQESAAAACVAQLDRMLDAATPARSRITVAYEPEWAIGAARAASPDHIAHVARALTARLAERADTGEFSVIYGGSAGPGLLATLGSSVDGLFLGRFAHDPAALERVLDETSDLP